MTIKFKTCYISETSSSIVQADLLRMWADSLDNYQIKFIKDANIEFIDYLMLEYPEREKLREEYIACSTDFFNATFTEELLKETLKTFDTDFRVMELVITPKEYD